MAEVRAAGGQGVEGVEYAVGDGVWVRMACHDLALLFGLMVATNLVDFGRLNLSCTARGMESEESKIFEVQAQAHERTTEGRRGVLRTDKVFLQAR